MRKLWCAGAIASGVLLLTAAPASADVQPAPGTAPGALSTALGYALEPTNDWRLGTPLASDPLSGQPFGADPMLQFEPGRDRALLQLGQRNDAVVQHGAMLEGTTPAKNTKAGRATGRPLAPAADVLRTMPRAAAAPTAPLGGMPVHGPLGGMPLAGQDMRIANLPVDGLVGRLSGLSPAGQPTYAFVPVVPVTPAGAQGTRTPSPDERPIAPRLERQQSDYPLLGGLAGALPVITRQVADVQSDFSGMPIGSPVPMARSAKATTPDDGATPATSATPSPSAPAPDASAPATDAPATDGPTADAPASDAPAGDSPTGNAPTGSTPAGDAPDASAPASPATTGTPATPAPDASTGLAGAQKPKSATSIDDPRLHEEPVDGFVTRDKQ